MRHKWMLAVGLMVALAVLGQKKDSPETMLGAGLHQEEVEGNCREAIKIYQKVIQEKSTPRNVAARAQLHIGMCQEKLAQLEARGTYEEVLRKYADQAEIAAAATRHLDVLRAGESGVPQAPPEYLGVWSGTVDQGDGSPYPVSISIFGGGIGTIVGTVTYLPPSKCGGQLTLRSVSSGSADGVGKEDLLTESELAKMPMSWSLDGKSLVYWIRDPQTSSDDEWLVPLSGDRKPAPLLQSKANENHAQVSPDGKWIAYFGNEDGQGVFVRPYPSGDGRWKVSDATGRGNFPRWRGDGKELFYLSSVNNGKLMAVDIRVVGSSIQAGTPHALFDSGYVNITHGTNYHVFAVSPDGQRFLIPRPVATQRPN